MQSMKNWFSRHLWAISVCYFVFYFILFFTLEQVLEPKYLIHSPLDDRIPFCEWFIIPYASWFFLIAGALLWSLFHSREDYLRLCFLMYTGMTLCLLIYVIAPNGLNLRVELTRDNWASKLVGMLQSVDTPTNVCPSIHVVVTLAINIVMLRSRAWRGRWIAKCLITALAVLICASTVFLKQHSVIDVFWGIVVAAVLLMVQLIWERGRNKKRSGSI